jgi:hypothetical protein
MASPTPRNWCRAHHLAKQNLLGFWGWEAALILTLTLALAMQSNVPNTWQMGGGRAWMNPPTVNCRFRIPKCRPELDANFRLSVIDSTAIVEAGAKRGYVPAMRLMGYMLFDGNKLQPDQAAAAGWFYEAAIRGDHASMIMLSHVFYNGIGVEPDQRLADYWLKRAADVDVDVFGRR